MSCLKINDARPSIVAELSSINVKDQGRMYKCTHKQTHTHTHTEGGGVCVCRFALTLMIDDGADISSDSSPLTNTRWS